MQDIADSRGLQAEEVRSLVDQAPFIGDKSVEVGLVDRMEDWTSFVDRLEDQHTSARAVTARSYLKRGSKAKRGPKIAVVTAVGTIMRGSSGESFNPLFGGPVMGSDTISKAFRSVRKTKGIEAVVFRVDSPGGSAVASEIIRQEMVRTAEKIPVVSRCRTSQRPVAIGSAVARSASLPTRGRSPGRSASMGATSIPPGFTTTSSVSPLAVCDRGANANIYGELEDWTDEQRAVIDRMLDRIYDDFVERVRRLET